MNLSKFNYMIEVNVCLLIFAAMVTLMLLLGTATDHARKNLLCGGSQSFWGQPLLC